MPVFPNGKGREFTAADAKYSFDRVCDPVTGTLGFDYYKNYVVGASEYFDEVSAARKGIPHSKTHGCFGLYS